MNLHKLSQIVSQPEQVSSQPEYSTTMYVPRVVPPSKHKPPNSILPHTIEFEDLVDEIEEWDEYEPQQDWDEHEAQQDWDEHEAQQDWDEQEAQQDWNNQDYFFSHSHDQSLLAQYSAMSYFVPWWYADHNHDPFNDSDVD